MAPPSIATDVEPAGDTAESAERGGDVVELDTDLQRHGRRAGRVGHVVHAAQRQRDLAEASLQVSRIGRRSMVNRNEPDDGVDVHGANVVALGEP